MEHLNHKAESQVSVSGEIEGSPSNVEYSIIVDLINIEQVNQNDKYQSFKILKTIRSIRKYI